MCSSIHMKRKEVGLKSIHNPISYMYKQLHFSAIPDICGPHQVGYRNLNKKTKSCKGKHFKSFRPQGILLSSKLCEVAARKKEVKYQKDIPYLFSIFL
jgi:hypothetical protein